MSAEATRMQDLASEFSKNFPGRHPRSEPPQREGRPPPAPTPTRPLAGRGAQVPRCWDPNLSPPQFFSRGCAPESKCNFIGYSTIAEVSFMHLEQSNSEPNT